MSSIWYQFIDEHKDQIPYKPLSVILEAFYWYCQMVAADDLAYKTNCRDTVYNLMVK